MFWLMKGFSVSRDTSSPSVSCRADDLFTGRHGRGVLPANEFVRRTRNEATTDATV
jgi:hypothetical protein